MSLSQMIRRPAAAKEAANDPAGGAVTMTSLELVEFINASRMPDQAELRHADFLAKFPLVLRGGERDFSFTYRDVQNKERPCYHFPKREACLMAMSYSYDLQAKVFDRMSELEAARFAVPTTLAGALRLAAEQAEQILNVAQRRLPCPHFFGHGKGWRCRPQSLPVCTHGLNLKRYAVTTSSRN
jgi:hypothetical protein